MELGWRIPSFARRETTAKLSRSLVPYCVAVEQHGFSAIWVIDHLLVAPNVYSVAWQDPLITLAVAAGATEKIRLGTSILVAPVRHPTLIAKEIATLDHLSGGGRVILGIGTGHDVKEFESVGVSKRERGKRTDEALELVQLLLSEDDVHYEGKYYQVDGISIYPRPEKRIPIWIGGGSQVHVVDNPDMPNMVPAVLRRIERHDGWICRSSGTSPEIVKGDIDTVVDHIGRSRDMNAFTVAHAQWLHIVPSTNRAQVIKEQLAAYRGVMDKKRSDDDLQSAYLFGTIDEMIEQIRALKKSNIQHLMLNPLIEDQAQVDLFAKEIMPNI
ncbi:MAG: LLM class flavin-dependent oxidoreductase [Chromatiales bacterium]|jgi:probable F420-dependent oxidoreductase|nr:LLM class flavin-dependent oxidoreductase [Chromatiales bacterium]